MFKKNWNDRYDLKSLFWDFLGMTYRLTWLEPPVFLQGDGSMQFTRPATIKRPQKPNDWKLNMVRLASIQTIETSKAWVTPTTRYAHSMGIQLIAKSYSWFTCWICQSYSIPLILLNVDVDFSFWPLFFLLKVWKVTIFYKHAMGEKVDSAQLSCSFLVAL